MNSAENWVTTPTRYNVVKRDKDGTFISVISGLGSNAGTWDGDHSRSAAYKHAAQCRRDDPNKNNLYFVEPST